MSASRSASLIPGNLKLLAKRLHGFIRWAILLMTAGYTFLDYWGYSRVQHEDPSSWQKLAAGQGIVPAQYRVGVYYSANLFARMGHLQFRHIFALTDGVCLLASLAILFLLLTKREGFRILSPAQQWSQVLLALLLTQIYLGWTLWFQEPETMPSLMILASSALLCSGHVRVPRSMLALTLLLVALLGATIRVDAVVAFHAGMLLVCMVALGRGMPLGRGWQAAISVASLALALGTAYYLAHFVFPHNAREVALLQLPDNLRSLTGAMVLLCTLPPWLLTMWLAARRLSALDSWTIAMLAGSLIDFGFFVTFGMSEEVRIFLPFAMILVPVSAPILMGWMEQGSSVPDR